MDDTIPMPLGDAEPLPAAAPPKAEPLAVSFTASGSEYFRIWIVNLGLTLVTLGLYYPWAKVRKLRYFYTNTRVAGHAFDFHGNPRRMLRGYFLIVVLFWLYSAAGRFSALAAALALTFIAALWPALLQASQRFRMANTSWRGLRFSFTGSVRDAYAAVLPIALPLLVFAFASPDVDEHGRAINGNGTVMLLAALAGALAAPWCWWRIKRFQHGNFALGRRKTTFSAGLGSFYGAFIRTAGIFVIVVVVGAAVMGAVVGFSLQSLRNERPSAGFVFMMVAVTLAFYVLFFCVIRTYAMARLQNLAWSGTAALPLLRFESRLRFRALAWLTAKNLLLTLLTVGLYWPFAAVATARLRLQAVSVFMPQGADHFAASTGAGGAQDASGDAAGDVFGIDVGF